MPTPQLDTWNTIDLSSLLDDISADESMTEDRACGLLDQDSINVAGCKAFVLRHPEWPVTPNNAARMQAFLEGLPMTVWNCELAFNSLREMGVLEPVEPAEPKVIVRRRSPGDAPPPNTTPDDATLRTMPLSELKKLADAERQHVKRPVETVDIVEPDYSGVPTFMVDGDTPTLTTRGTTPAVQGEHDLRKLSLADLKKLANADRIANRTLPVQRTLIL